MAWQKLAKLRRIYWYAFTTAPLPKCWQEEIDFETDESKGVDLGEDLLAKRLKTK